MPWNGSQPNKTFGRTDGTDTGSDTWVNADDAGRDIVAVDHDTHDQDMADGINACINKNGDNTAAASLPMGGFIHTGVGDATAQNHYLNVKQHANEKGKYCATVGGTADVITITTGFSYAAYVAGATFSFIAGGTNTVVGVTVNVDSLGAKTIKSGVSSLAVGQIVSGTLCVIQYDGTYFQLLSSATRLGTGPSNLGLAMSVGSSALTIALKGADGNDPSATNAVGLPFRNVTAATGTPTWVDVTSATTVVVSSGSTLATTDNVAFKLWVVAFNDAGTVRLGVINTFTTNDIFALGKFALASSTAEGGAGGADSGQVFYTGTAVTSKAYCILGYATWESGLGTAGTWSAGPTRIDLITPTTPLPGTIVQTQRDVDATRATGTTVIPGDNTIPQNTEGDQFMSQAITPTSAAHQLLIRHHGTYDHDTTGNAITVCVFQDTTADALYVERWSRADTGGATSSGYLEHRMRAGTTSATTFKIRAGLGAAGTTGFNSQGAAAVFGGTMISWIEIVEMAT